jgi:hypothetical protein
VAYARRACVLQQATTRVWFSPCEWDTLHVSSCTPIMADFARYINHMPPAGTLTRSGIPSRMPGQEIAMLG